eukprot:Em0005g1307a
MSLFPSKAKPSDLDLFINMNAASVLEQQKLQREKHKVAHEAKVEKDKQSRQVQKQKPQRGSSILAKPRAGTLEPRISVTQFNNGASRVKLYALRQPITSATFVWCTAVSVH